MRRYIHGENQEKNSAIKGRLNLVDLAGSERLDKSHSKGEALEEAKFINRSLSALSNVFINIRNNSAHVNFRDSKLTMMLKDCLSKEGKTLMFVNLSPDAESAQESLCSLNFAATANQCKQGQAKRKVTRRCIVFNKHNAATYKKVWRAIPATVSLRVSVLFFIFCSYVIQVSNHLRMSPCQRCAGSPDAYSLPSPSTCPS